MRASLYTYKNPIKIGFTSFIWASFVHAFQASLPLNLDVSTSPNQKGLLATSSSEPNIRFLLSAMSSCHGSQPIQKSGDHQLIWSISHYLKGFIHVRWCRISSINSITVDDESKINCNWLSSLSYIAYFWCQKVSVSATFKKNGVQFGTLHGYTLTHSLKDGFFATLMCTAKRQMSEWMIEWLNVPSK